MLLTLLLFFGSAIAIYLACGLLVNGVEWLGYPPQLRRVQLSRSVLKVWALDNNSRVAYPNVTIFSETNWGQYACF
jgi:hypothetical protein